MDHVQYIVVGSSGLVTKVVDIPVPDMPMIHDMSLTASYAIVYDLPVTVDFDAVMAGSRFPFAWKHDRPARVGLLPRNGTADQIIWCDVDPCFVFHPLNVYDADDGTVVVDVCRYDTMMVSDRLGPFGDSLATFDRWVIDPVANRVHETRLDDRPQEFPRHNPRVGLQRHRYGYTSEVITDGINLHGATIKIDVENGTTEAHEYGRGGGAARSRSSSPRWTAPPRTPVGSCRSCTTPPPTRASSASSTPRTSPVPRWPGSICHNACRSDSIRLRGIGGGEHDRRRHVVRTDRRIGRVADRTKAIDGAGEGELGGAEPVDEVSAADLAALRAP